MGTGNLWGGHDRKYLSWKAKYERGKRGVWQFLWKRNDRKRKGKSFTVLCI